MKYAPLAIFTDLDGTLLDHHTYSYAPAQPMLDKLRGLSISVMPTTSKTRAEVELLRHELRLDTPFIVENGAAIYLPVDWLPNQPEGTESVGAFYRKSFSQPRSYWLEQLKKLPSALQSSFIGFNQMTDQQISLATGLAEHDAHLANQREFSEPLKWLGSDAEKEQLKQYMQSIGANVLQGGRFVHISGKCNKGMALLWLRKEMSTQLGYDFQSVALGDSYNDNDMLEAADIAVQIKTDKHEFPTLFRKDAVFQSTLLGPKGWNECLEQVLQQFNLTNKER